MSGLRPNALHSFPEGGSYNCVDGPKPFTVPLLVASWENVFLYSFLLILYYYVIHRLYLISPQLSQGYLRINKGNKRTGIRTCPTEFSFRDNIHCTACTSWWKRLSPYSNFIKKIERQKLTLVYHKCYLRKTGRKSDSTSIIQAKAIGILT